MAEKKRPPRIFECDYELADMVAVQCVAAGVADKGQQQRALKWIIENASMTYDVTFQMEGERASAFAEGRRFVGLNIVKAIKLNTSVLTKTKKEQG